jgi:Domain of unknown function (DUF4942)
MINHAPLGLCVDTIRSWAYSLSIDRGTGDHHMISTSHELIKKESIAELIAHRDRALELYKAAAELLVEAGKASMMAHPSSNYIALDRHDAECLISSYHIDQGNAVDVFMKEVQPKLDRKIWRHLVDSTGLGGLMDNKAREDFEKQIRANVQPATVDNVVATFMTHSAAAPEIFERGLVNAFSNLRSGYKTNNAFKIDNKVIFDGALQISFWGKSNHYHHYWSQYGRGQHEIMDVERTLRILDGQKPFESRYEGVIGAIDAAAKEGGFSAETEYFKIVWFKKGSVHITFKRPDLIEKANRIIAKHYGETIPDGEGRHKYQGTRKRATRKKAA